MGDCFVGELLGVVNGLASARFDREEGVWGACAKEGNGIALDLRCDVRGVIGKGAANSFGVRFTGLRLRRDFFVGEAREGDGGACKGACSDVDAVFGDLGESEAKRLVKADCLLGGGVSLGRAAKGSDGTVSLSSYSCRIS